MIFPAAFVLTLSSYIQASAPEVDLTCRVTETAFLEGPIIEEREIVVQLRNETATIIGGFADGEYVLHVPGEVRTRYLARDENSLWSDVTNRPIQRTFLSVDRFTGEIHANAFYDTPQGVRLRVAFIVEGTCREASQQF